MPSKWEEYSKTGLGIASTLSSVGFSAAKTGTKIGFGITRGITHVASSAAGITLDYALFGRNNGTGSAVSSAMGTAITAVENLTLAPILFGESLTSTSLVAAQASIDTLAALFPGSDEASFSLASFVQLVKREWSEPAMGEQLPAARFSVAEIGRALVAWGALQSVTQLWQEERWFAALEEIHVEAPRESAREAAAAEDIHVTMRAARVEDGGEVVSADIGAASVTAPSRSSTAASSPVVTSLRTRGAPPRLPVDAHMKSTLRRLSKMCLAGYGGTGMIFFGVPLIPPSVPTADPSGSTVNNEQAVADVLNDAENEAKSSPAAPAPIPAEPQKQFSWWNVLMGKHDREILEAYAFTPPTVRISDRKGKGRAKPQKPSAITAFGNESRLPRYWVIADHGRKQVVLVFRGTFSFNELAVDLTCEPAPFQTASSSVPRPQEPIASRGPEEKQDNMPGSFSTGPSAMPRKEPEKPPEEPEIEPNRLVYEVHGGMLRMARLLGAKGKPVQRAVDEALRRNRRYELVICGHSLGAGIAALLALIWADPRTCLTVPASGLPEGRRVSAYCFASPCVADAALGKLSSSLITSFVYSHDVVSRLSLGAVRDLVRAASWLCEGNAGKGGEGYTAVTRRALKWKAGFKEEGDDDWFLALRKTLEASMQMAHLYPPGRVLWALRDGDLHPEHRLPGGASESNVRLFEVHDVEVVFGQMVFARDMLSSHLPHQYDRILHDLL